MIKSSAKTFKTKKPPVVIYRRANLDSIPSVMTKATDKTGTEPLRIFWK